MNFRNTYRGPPKGERSDTPATHVARVRGAGVLPICGIKCAKAAKLAKRAKPSGELRNSTTAASGVSATTLHANSAKLRAS